ncbi:MAG: response regulator transcription factor [Hyphomicrobiaceae bacterium]|nr:response regulator transcription factor [Hyphomicrobiaceae bacterium]
MKQASDSHVGEGAEELAPEARIVICDDDSDLRHLLGEFLVEHRFAVVGVGSGRELDRLMRSGAQLDLIILDIMLPGQSGIEICRNLREQSNLPILMLTARGDETDRIVGLEIGADDYVSKPFSPNELLARIKALLRRSRISGGAGMVGRKRSYEFEGWRLDLLRRELRNPRGVIVDLSAGEYDLLVAFLEMPQRVLSRDQLLDAARSTDATNLDRSIDVQVSRLRRKIDTGAEGESFIKTVRGAGYMLVAAVRSS